MIEHKRFTEKLNDGTYEIAESSCVACGSYKLGCSDRDCKYVVLNRLGELEDHLESTRVVELPCDIGDTVYVVDNGFKPHIKTYTVKEIQYAGPKEIWLKCEQKGLWRSDYFLVNNVFFSEADAETSLAELINSKNINFSS